MKRGLLVATVLFISVISTACINNLAVQELNTKAKTFIEQGDYASAVERLKSSIDLEPSAYESHYNLAVAYTKLDDYANAVESYKNTIKLNPDFADAYYSLAVCEENLITDIEGHRLVVDETGKVVPAQEENSEDIDLTKPKTLTDADKNYIEATTQDVIANYEKYLSLSENPSDKAVIEKRLQELKNQDVEQEVAE